MRATRTERRFHADGHEADYRRRTTSSTWDWQPGSFRPIAQTVARHERGYTQHTRHALVTDVIGTPRPRLNAKECQVAVDWQLWFCCCIYAGEARS